MIRWTSARKFEAIQDMLQVIPERRQAWIDVHELSLDEVNEWLTKLHTGGLKALKATRRSKAKELANLLMPRQRGRISSKQKSKA